MFSKLKYNFYKNFHENNKNKYIYNLKKSEKEKIIYKKVIYDKKKYIKYILFFNSLIFINNYNMSLLSYFFYSSFYWFNLIKNNNEFFNDYKIKYNDLIINFIINNLLIYKNFIGSRSNIYEFYLSLIIISLNIINFINNIRNKVENNKKYLNYNNSEIYFDFYQTVILFINFFIINLKDKYFIFFFKYMELFFMIKAMYNLYIIRKN